MTEAIKNLPTPDPRIMRAQDRAKSRAGELLATACPHPMSAIYQFEDVITEKHRQGRPTNLFQCDICKRLLWLVDGHGREASEG